MFPTSILQGTYNQSSGSGIADLTAPGTESIFGFQANGNGAANIIFTSSNQTTPVEAKRLYLGASSTSDDVNASLAVYFTGSLQVGTVLYSNSGKTTTLATTWGSSYMTNDIAQFAVLPDGSNWTLLSGADPTNFYWISMQKSNSTVTAITENANVTTNVLKDVGTNTSGVPNSSYGGFVLNGTAYGSHTAALAATLSSSTGLGLFYDGPGSYPKTNDRTYVTNTSVQSGVWGGAGWAPFTKAGASIDFAVKFGNASNSGSNIGTIPSNNNLWIEEIRNSSGNVVTEIT